MEKVISSIPETGIEGVLLTGGEPMLDPGAVFRTIELIKNIGADPHVQTSFLGKSKEEIEENAKTLARLGVKGVQTSLSMYHERSKPEWMDDYLDYLIEMLNSLTKNGLPVGIKNTWDTQTGYASADYANKFADKLDKKGGHFVTKSDFGDRWYYFSMNGQEIKVYDPAIISVGKARVKGLRSQRMGDDDRLYECPIFYEPQHEGGMLTILPNGNAARCCSFEGGADFGMGNAYNDSLAEMIHKIRGNHYVYPQMHRFLEEGHKMLREEFPHLLPDGGPNQACEICSPIISRKKTRERLTERLGMPGLFSSDKG